MSHYMEMKVIDTPNKVICLPVGYVNLSPHLGKVCAINDAVTLNFLANIKSKGPIWCCTDFIYSHHLKQGPGNYHSTSRIIKIYFIDPLVDFCCLNSRQTKHAGTTTEFLCVCPITLQRGAWWDWESNLSLSGL